MKSSQLKMAKEKSLERTLSVEEFKDVITEAEALRTSDLMRKDKRLQDSALAATLSSGDGISLPVAYSIAGELNIPSRYVEQVLARHQSKEEMLAQLHEIGARPSFEVFLDVYTRYLSSLLQEGFPLEVFRVKVYDSTNGNIRVQRVATNPKGLIERIFNKETIAKIKYLHTSKIDVHIYSPIFTKACIGTLERLNERFGKRMSATFHYDVYPEKEVSK